MEKLFLDTNIVIDFLGERVPFYEPAAKILTLADLRRIQLYTSSTTISTAYYLLRKSFGKAVALEKISKFKLLCSISIMGDEVIEKAILSDFNDFEDALQYFSALATGCA